jgi:hypothetical protein
MREHIIGLNDKLSALNHFVSGHGFPNSSVAVDFPPVSDPDHRDNQSLLYDCVDHAVVTRAYAPKPILIC